MSEVKLAAVPCEADSCREAADTLWQGVYSQLLFSPQILWITGFRTPSWKAKRKQTNMAMSTSIMRASLGNVAAFAPLRPAVRRARIVAPVRAEKSLGDKIQEKTDVGIRFTRDVLCVRSDCP